MENIRPDALDRDPDTTSGLINNKNKNDKKNKTAF
jgi:hypothetical protein